MHRILMTKFQWSMQQCLNGVVSLPKVEVGLHKVCIHV